MPISQKKNKVMPFAAMWMDTENTVLSEISWKKTKHCIVSLTCNLKNTNKYGLPRWLRKQSVHVQCGRLGFNPSVGKIPGERNGNPLQYSCLDNSMDGGAW